MKFEKLSDTKIRITVTIQDLVEKDIDFHVFMSNSIESQNILLDMLDEAKKQTGFDPEDYNLKIEALAMADSDFIFTITKIVPDEKGKLSKKKFTIKRKEVDFSATQTAYCFNSFDDFCGFVQFLRDNFELDDVKNIAESVVLYTYQGLYYLVMGNICVDIASKLKFYAIITEFAKHVTNSKVFVGKLEECGNSLIKHNALEIGLTYFSKA
ncbi:MAG: adaptor protein MecA [Clostridia bacterium]|nr:adaptor protein MecA [Clostridia bacterium]